MGEVLVADALAEAAASVSSASSFQGSTAVLPPSLLLWQLEALASAHHMYPHLFEACEAIGRYGGGSGGSSSTPSTLSAQRLQQHMMALGPEAGAGEQETFARCVCEALAATSGLACIDTAACILTAWAVLLQVLLPALAGRGPPRRSAAAASLVHA